MAVYERLLVKYVVGFYEVGWASYRFREPELARGVFLLIIPAKACFGV